MYDGKSYVNANTTVKSGDKIIKDAYTDEIKFERASVIEELDGIEATDTKYQNGERAIEFENGDFVGIKNGDGICKYEFIPYRYMFDDSGCVINMTTENSVFYYDDYEYYSVYSGASKTDFRDEPDETKKVRGVSKGYDFSHYQNDAYDFYWDD